MLYITRMFLVQDCNMSVSTQSFIYLASNDRSSLIAMGGGLCVAQRRQEIMNDSVLFINSAGTSNVMEGTFLRSIPLIIEK